MTTVSAQKPRLLIRFHGRIIDHLGIQMYESPIAAIAELVANAWDAEAENIGVDLPLELNDGATIVIRDDGNGMTFAECQDHYLNVGYMRRGDDPAAKTVTKHRPVLGRKGIGKFAGFGIAGTISVDTTSVQTGEHTFFELGLDELRAGKYVSEDRPLENVVYEEPSESRRGSHGTVITLGKLKLAKAPSTDVFRRGLGRRFLLHQRAADFHVHVSGQPVTDVGYDGAMQFEFPRDYTDEERPTGLIAIDETGWGSETLDDGSKVRWRVHFYKEPIKDDELRGFSVFANQKLAQMPFFFNLSGGLSGQHGQQYLSGQIEADFIDTLPEDLITTERQRINWSRRESEVLLEWGRTRTKELLRIWHDRRGSARVKKLKEKVEGFSERLNRLGKHERETVATALTRLAGVSSLDDEDFEQIGGAVLTAWEAGRLKDLITDIAHRKEFAPEELIKLLAEQQVLEALHAAEIVKSKLEAIRGLANIVAARELENEIRDYIAQRPWLLDQRWVTFVRETSLKHVFDEATAAAHLTDEQKGKRIDLALRSGEHLLVVEFMRPGVIIDWDHLQRAELYVRAFRSIINANTALGIKRVTGLIVADKLDRKAVLIDKISSLAKEDILVYDWESLLADASAKWKDFLGVLVEREPDDSRLQSFRENG